MDIHNLENAKKTLLESNYTCVLCHEDCCHTSSLRGVKPLVQWYVSGADFSQFAAADKVIGRATAFLYQLMGIRTVYAHVISRPALAVFETHGVYVQYGQLVDNIINRKGDGLCPFEDAVLNIQQPRQAYDAILQKMQELNISL